MHRHAELERDENGVDCHGLGMGMELMFTTVSLFNKYITPYFLL